VSGLRSQLERAITDALERAGRALSPTTRRIVGRAVEHVVEPMIYQLVAERDQARAELDALHARRGRDVPEGSRTN
jgi:hypothetical protein